MITGELKSQIDKVWNAFWTGGISNPLTVIEQMTYLLFIKRLDELHTQREQKASFTGKPIEDPVFEEAQYHLRWSRFKDIDPEEMHRLFTQADGVFDFLKSMGKADSSFTRFMKNASFIIPTPRLLSQVVDLLDQIPMADRDTKGDVYEYLLSKIATAGQNGQFRTPRHIIRMMVEMVQPTTEDIICDPSAGSCGFLVAASEYIREHEPQALLKEAVKARFQSITFMGMEFDPTMIRIGAMNMILHGIENPALTDVDSLSEANTDFANKATIILANPPFKGSLDKDAVDTKVRKIVDSSKTELLFLGLMLKGLQTGGRCAVIVPDGVLFGSSKAHKQIRRELIENQKLNAVISMPSGVFKPYAGVSTAILIFTKTNSGGTDHVWFYDMQADGYSLDDKRTPLPGAHPEVQEGGHSEALEGQTTEVKYESNNIPDILTRWASLQKSSVIPSGAKESSDGKTASSLAVTEEKDRKRTDPSFLVPFEEIKENDWDLSINRYKEIEYEEIAYASPGEIIEEIETLDRERNEALEVLKGILG